MPTKVPGPGGGMGRGAGGYSSNGRSVGGNMRGTQPIRTQPNPIRLTGRGKAVVGGVAGATAWGVGKWLNDKQHQIQKNYDDLVKGFQGSAEQRSGMTENDYAQMMLKMRANRGKR